MKKLALAAALVTTISAGPSRGADEGPPWEEAFDASAAPPNVHFRGSYTDAKGGEHHFEVWRRGAARLVRNTDDRLVLYAVRGDDGSYVYKLVDKTRHLLIDVRQENLYRLGRFSDWASLSTMLQKPSQPHRVINLKRAQATSLGTCNWFRIEIGPRAEEVCWSHPWGLPMVMREAKGEGRFQFKIEAADREPNASAFRLDDKGLVPIHADEDIHPSD